MGVSWFGWGAVSSSRPADARAARTAAVKDGRRPPPQAARSVLDGGEHDATLKAAPAKNQPRALSRLTPKGERSLNREPTAKPGATAPPACAHEPSPDCHAPYSRNAATCASSAVSPAQVIAAAASAAACSSPGAALSRVSAAVSTCRRFDPGSSKPATSRNAGIPTAAKLAWSELRISTGCTPTAPPTCATAERTNAGSAENPLVSAVSRELPATESRLTFSAIAPRSPADNPSSHTRDPVSAHSSALNNASSSPRRHPATCGASARATASAAATPVALSSALSPGACPSRCALSTTRPGPPPGRSNSNVSVSVACSAARTCNAARARPTDGDSRAADSGEIPSAGMPASSPRPEDPATTPVGNGPAIRNPLAPASRAAVYLTRRCRCPLANMYSCRTSAMRPASEAPAWTNSSPVPRPRSITSAVTDPDADRISGRQGSGIRRLPSSSVTLAACAVHPPYGVGTTTASRPVARAPASRSSASAVVSDGVPASRPPQSHNARKSGHSSLSVASAPAMAWGSVMLRSFYRAPGRLPHDFYLPPLSGTISASCFVICRKLALDFQVWQRWQRERRHDVLHHQRA